MTQEMSDARLQAALELPPARRHAWFLQRVRESGEAWGLYAEGWALAVDDEGRDVLPLWPTSAAARLCATHLWEGFEPRLIPLQELLEPLVRVLGDLAQDNQLSDNEPEHEKPIKEYPPIVSLLPDV